MLFSKNRQAIIWSGVGKVSTYIVNFGIQIVLAHLLCPDDYAVVAMLAIFFAISEALIDGGFAAALIQKQNCSQEDYSSVFYFNLVVGAIFFLGFFFAAPLIEQFYHFPNLSIVTRVYSINLLINSIALVHRMRLTKELKFKEITIITTTSAIISVFPAVIMAYFGFGYWALVVQALCKNTIGMVMQIYYSKWKPSWHISIKSLKELAPFGLSILFVYFFNAIYSNIYSLLIGKKFSSVDLGYYDRGKTLASMGPVGFSDFFSQALFPILSKRQNETNALESSYNRSFSLICFVIIPISVFMSVFSRDVIYTLYGEQWLDTAWILQILCIGFLFYPLQALNVNMLKARASARLLSRSEFIKKTIGIIIVLVMVRFGLRAVVFGWTCYAIIEFFVSEFFFWKLYKFRLLESARVLFSTASLLLLLAFAISFGLKQFTSNSYWIFFVGGSLYVGVYGLLYYRKIRTLIK